MTTKIFSIALLCLCSAIQTWATSVDIGNDRVIGDGSSITLHADISIEGLRQEEYPIKWYKRLYTQTDYEATPFAEGTGTEVTLNNLTETTYIKVTVGDALGTICWDELVLIVPTITVSEISFINTQANIRQDPTPTNDSPPFFTAPHWTSTDSKPVWYKGGDRLKVSAKFTLVAPGSEQGLTPSNLMSTFVQNLRIKCAAGSDVATPTFLSPTTNLSQDGNTLQTVADLECSTAFANQVGFYDPMYVIWKISYTAGSEPFTTVGTTTNQVYVSNATSLLAPAERYHTTIHLSCKNAVGLSNPQAIVDAIYAEFTDRDVRKIGGTQGMKYWGDPLQNVSTDTKNLLKYQDGRCGSWVRLFMDMLKAQGIAQEDGSAVGYQHISVQRASNYSLDDNSVATLNTAILVRFGSFLPVNQLNNYVKKIAPPLYPLNVAAYFHVKEWEINSASVGKFYHCADTGYDNNNDGNGFNDDVIDEDANTSILAPGAAAQNNANPYSYFMDHSIVRYNGKYYDPSYGSPIFNSFADWQAASIEGFGAMVCLLDVAGQPYDINSPDRYIWLEKLNDGSLNEYPFPY